MTPNELGVALAKRLAVAALVVVLIVAAAFAIPATTNSTMEREPLETPEYDPDTLATTPIPAEGDIEADGSLGNNVGVVVIDDSHSNRISRAELAPLVRELTRIGYGVRFYDGTQTLDQELSNVNAFVVVDPAQEFDSDEIEDVHEFTEEGGHLLMVGEPNRKSISAGFFGTSVSDQESALTTLAGRYDMSLGTSYLYNLENNGGNYKHITTRPTPESELELDSVTMFTAAPVFSGSGTVLLRAAENTHEAGIDSTRRYPVAVHRAEENALLLGDSSFLRSDRYNVGDNEQFAAFLVEYLISGERVSAPDDEEDDEDATDDDGVDVPTDPPDETDGNESAVNNTTTPAPETPAADLVDPTSGVAAGTTTTGAVETTREARPVERFVALD
jgi:hypothetical protein